MTGGFLPQLVQQLFSVLVVRTEGIVARETTRSYVTLQRSVGGLSGLTVKQKMASLL